MKIRIVLLCGFVCVAVFPSSMETSCWEHFPIVDSLIKTDGRDFMEQDRLPQSKEPFEEKSQKEKYDDAYQIAGSAFDHLQKASIICIVAKTQKRKLTQEEETKVSSLVKGSKDTLSSLLQEDIKKPLPQISQALIILCKTFFDFVTEKDFSEIKSYINKSFDSSEKQIFDALQQGALKRLEGEPLDVLKMQVLSFGEALARKLEREELEEEAYLATIGG